ncbi:membrane protein [Methylacidiphilum kamchatkense Kam1]|uniref:Lipid A 3-O-deacylase PagL n=1 Tax=Methylacidiphilum kamchatkense Kam1 TaxID=1202785 RepID=A0A0C1RTZ5_9BACT|nr:acyloxyacyl hydrolase [Methylacidiphilum kamchatkense]KIE58461.1 membrane protein [Methylacidiphilum kamchatkense Kam1]QDQ43277.1 lipid A 3-O-deacylase PagL [Methylacidiphilum kamchatkense Kam1]
MRFLCSFLLGLAILLPTLLKANPGGSNYSEESGQKVENVSLKTEEIPEVALFKEGANEIMFMAGGLFSTGSGNGRYTFNEIPTLTYWGWMLTTPDKGGILRGNLELLIGLYASAIEKGFGSTVIGPQIMVRYNFVQPDSRFIPFIEGGLGFVYNDAYTVKTQSMVGQVIEFTPQLGAGCRYMLDTHWSFNFELLFHHMSNADMASRNIGVNELGGMIGFSYLLGRPH